ncbi:MAG: penicillin-binding transpeptidase domain-containing protein, partial [Akkermansiaceae bacterium]|nr:penicillin-binding transpeptidase domain-containing protein [Akkermansiaceae bacterium]
MIRHCLVRFSVLNSGVLKSLCSQLPSLLVVWMVAIASLAAQDEVSVVANVDDPAPGGRAPVLDPQAAPDASDASILTRKDARAITLKIPAPRGMIIGRDGGVFAQNRVVYRVSLQYKQLEAADRDLIVQWGRERLNQLQQLAEELAAEAAKESLEEAEGATKEQANGESEGASKEEAGWSFPPIREYTDDELHRHYVDRRWLPLYITTEIEAEHAKRIRDRLPDDVVLTPVYSRYYPSGKSAAHVIGYSGSEGKMPTGPINFNEPMWEEMEGRSGLEKLFNERLTGVPGQLRLVYDEYGRLLDREQTIRPIPGGTVVTTLNHKWQQIAEQTLEEGCERGAFVVIDCVSGEVLVLASWPSFDLNEFIPRISSDAFKALNEDPATPLYGRAFQSAYPPASTFKPIVALAALNRGLITAESLIDCPVAIEIGDKVFKNWADKPEGRINVMRAIQRSCNTWFYQVAIALTPEPMIELARNLGFGQRTGLPLIGETPGILPDNEWMRKHENRPILKGDTANLSIGQGSLLASPLQVCQMMAGIGNGQVLPELKLVNQLQDKRGQVIESAVPEPRKELGLSAYSVAVTRLGMSDVVNRAGGTGLGAQLSYTTLCGKTGTAQWGPEDKNQRLAWFAGFLPEDNP